MTPFSYYDIKVLCLLHNLIPSCIIQVSCTVVSLFICLFILNKQMKMIILLINLQKITGNYFDS